MPVTHCICFQSFASAIEKAREAGCANVRELQEQMDISANCGLCVPYVQRAIETGETAFDVMNKEESAYWIERSATSEEERSS